MSPTSQRNRRLAEYERMAQPGFIPESKSGAGRLGRTIQLALRPRPHSASFPPRKEEAPCCLKKRLPDGRPVIGFCSAECIRRPANWALVVAGKPIPKGGALNWRPPGPQQEQRKETA